MFKKINLLDILTITAVLSVIFFGIFTYTHSEPTYKSLNCYDPNIEVGFTKGKYIPATNCNYDENEGIWYCNEGEFKYCN